MTNPVRSFLTNTNQGPQGTQMSDGTRVGPVLDVDGLPGIYESCYQLYQVKPAAPLIITASATTIGPGYIPIVPGTGCTAISFNGETVYQLDVPRGISVNQATAGTVINITIWSYDVWGQPMTEQITLDGGGETGDQIYGLKAHYLIRKIYADGVTGSGSDISVGTTGLLGLPYYTPDFGSLASVYWEGTNAYLAASALVVGDTSPVSLTSGDVRGTLTPPTALDGISSLFVHAAVTGALAPVSSGTSTLYYQAAVQGVPQYSKPYI